MINEINELLDQGIDVYLECIDKEGFLNIDDGDYYSENEIILESNLKVRRVFDSCIELSDCFFNILDDEFKYFKIKQTSSVMRTNFEKLILKSLQALKENKLTDINISKSKCGLNYVTLYNDQYELARVFEDELDEGLEFINNLLESKFTIGLYLLTIKDSGDIDTLRSTNKQFNSLSEKFNEDQIKELLKSNLDSKFIATLLNDVTITFNI